MDIPQRTMNAVGKRDESIKRWLNSSTAKAQQKTDDTHFKITFDNGSMLLSAVSAGDIEEVERLLQLGTDVNFSSADGLTALHQACIDEYIELVEILIKAGANINARDNEGWTPLHAAASTTSLEIVSYLVKNGANLSAVNTDGELPVDLTDEDDIKDFLMEEISSHKINLKSARNLEHDKMLKDITEWISKGTANEIRDPQGASSLHVAASKSYMDLMELLVNRLKIDINIKDNDGWTPLHAAVYWKQLDAVAFLLDHNADYQAKTTIGLLPIDLADEDIILKYKAMLRKKNVSVSYSKKSISGEDGSDDLSNEIFPHSYKPFPTSILKKVSSLTTIPKSGDIMVNSNQRESITSNISLPLYKIIPNIVKPNDVIASTSTGGGIIHPPPSKNTSIFPPISKPTNTYIDNETNALSDKLSGIQLPPRSTTTNTTDFKSYTSNIHSNIPRPGVVTSIANPSTSKINLPPNISLPNTTTSSSSSISRPPLPVRFDPLSGSIPSSTAKTANNFVSKSSPYKTVDEAIAEIGKLKAMVELLQKDKDNLEKQLQNLKISNSKQTPTMATTNTSSSINDQLIKENERLQQENATLIKAMATLNKSKSVNRP